MLLILLITLISTCTVIDNISHSIEYMGIQVHADLLHTIIDSTGFTGLAKWLVSKENPLTARVQVNRLWMMLFGKGLVATQEDFGNQGNLPSHPELLDYLAVDFMENGWDIKAFLKKIYLKIYLISMIFILNLII